MRKLLRVIIGVAALVSSSAYADELEALPVTLKDLTYHLGVDAFKWSYEAKKPFELIDIQMLSYTRDENGLLVKEVLYSWGSGVSEPYDAGLYPITVILSGDKITVDFLSQKIARALDKSKDYRATCVGSPQYIDQEYIFKINYKEGSRRQEKEDMESYLCMTIESKMRTDSDNPSSE